MRTKLLSGVAAAFIALGTVSATAATADAVLLGRLSGATELTQSGVAAVDFVQGHEIGASRINHAVAASEVRAGEQTARYYDDSLALTIGMLALAALAFVGVALASRALGKGQISEPSEPEGWREEVMRMLEADLTNMDGLKHRLSAH
jgi:hypothetical protein